MRKISKQITAICLLLTAYCLLPRAYAQYAPQAMVLGTTAISATSRTFVSWATHCSIKRGYLNIAQPSMGYTIAGDSNNAIGSCDNTIVSLGDSGVAVLTFASPIINGAGFDFAVFENGFANPANPEEAFLEFAFVEVSSDGIHYTRFPATSNIPTSPQIPAAGVYTNARFVNNLAGKYIARYGTPFDLQELDGTPGLDINYITHVRLVDVVGDVGNFGTTDHLGNKINDPYPSAFPTGGFDLDAVGVIHQQQTGVADYKNSFSIYPNPATEAVFIESINNDEAIIALTDITGKILQTAVLNNKTILQLTQLNAGIYFITISDKNGNRCVEKIIRL